MLQALLFLAIAVLLFMLFDLRFSIQKNTLIHCDPGKIKLISLSSSNAENTFLLRRLEGKGWRLEQEDSDFSNPSEKFINAWLQKLCSMPYNERIEMSSNAQSSPEYGVSDSLWRLVVDEAERSTITIGALAPSSAEYFVKRSGDDQALYVVPNTVIQRVFPSLLELIENPLQVIEAGELHVQSDYHGIDFLLSRDQTWKQVSGEPRIQDPEALVKVLKSLRFLGFFSSLQKDDERFQVENAEFALTWKSGQEERSFLLVPSTLGKTCLMFQTGDTWVAFIILQDSLTQLYQIIFGTP